MDQAPGPTIAKMTPSRACTRRIHGSPTSERYCEKAIATLTIAASVPAAGVHRPITSSTPAPAPVVSRTTVVSGDPSRRLAIPKWMSAAPVSSRKRRSPVPGQPPAKPENSRCKTFPFTAYETRAASETPGTGGGPPHFRGVLQFDDAALKRERDRVGSVVCSQLGEYIRDVALDRVLRNTELSGNLFVRVPSRNQSKHIDLP